MAAARAHARVEAGAQPLPRVVLEWNPCARVAVVVPLPHAPLEGEEGAVGPRGMTAVVAEDPMFESMAAEEEVRREQPTAVAVADQPC